MKQILFIALFFLSPISSIKCQGISSNGLQSDFRLASLYEELKNHREKGTSPVDKIKGSPYFDNTFKISEVNYFGTLLNEKIYLRYNAFSDEMEISLNSASDSENILIKNNKVFCILDGKTYRYLGFKSENNPPSVGYLKELFNGEIFDLYERKTKVYMEATMARTSLERSFPARFISKTEYYYSVNNKELNQIKLSKRKILSNLKSYSNLIKSFLVSYGVKLKSSNDLIEMFKFLEKKNS
tara:strand:+ start:252 stop:974 length:723 start_codon:yes stop_codon:yes gene_type:complete